MASPAAVTGSTSERLLQAAERLFAADGIDGVSLREISRAAGSRNVMAAQYHFTDRTGVVRAILAKHLPDVEARRHALLDEYEARDPELRALAAALVRPMAAKLDDADGGPEFLQIYGDLLNRPRPYLDLPEPSLHRWRGLAVELLDDEAVAMHRRFTAMLTSAIELGRRARGGPHDDDRLFTSWLIDVVAAVLGAPVSPETRRLRDARGRPRQGPTARSAGRRGR